MNKGIKIIIGLLLILAIILLGISIYLLGVNSGVKIENQKEDAYKTVDISDNSVGKNSSKKTVLDQMQGDKLSENVKSGGKIIFADDLLTIETQRSRPVVTDLTSEGIAVGYNTPAHVDYVLQNEKYDNKMYPWIALSIYDISIGVNDFLVQNKSSNNEYVRTLSRVQSLLNSGKVKDVFTGDSTGSRLMFPPPNAGCVEARSIKIIESNFMRGVRYITHCHQDRSYATGGHYVFQGVSDDGLKNIVFSYADVQASSLEKFYKDNPTYKNDVSESKIEKTFSILDSEKDENFLPSLFLIDEFLKSLKYE